jgi:DNA-binding MarR family transcriptional regulator
MTNGTSYLASAGERLDARAPMLVAAVSDTARHRATRAIEDCGWRATGFPIEGAIDRLALQAAASGLWIELDAGDSSDALDQLLGFANGEAAAGRMPVIVAAPPAMIDPVSARLDAAHTQVLIDPDGYDRAAAMALARAALDLPHTLHDVAQEPASRRLKQLSDEVGRIAATLAQLSSGPDAPAKTIERPATPAGEVPSVSGDMVRSMIRARRMRARFFDADLFADPAWDMLLDLLQAEIAQHRVPVSSLCIAAAVPATTALRWIKTMTDNGLFNRRADPHDGRRVFIELSPAASLALRRYFAEVTPDVAV